MQDLETMELDTLLVFKARFCIFLSLFWIFILGTLLDIDLLGHDFYEFHQLHVIIIFVKFDLPLEDLLIYAFKYFPLFH